MTEPQDKDEAKFNETLKRMLNTPPKPQKGNREKESAPAKDRDAQDE